MHAFINKFFLLNHIHPLIFITFLLIVGIWIQSIFYFFIFFCLIASFIIGFYSFFKNKNFYLLYILLSLLVGALLYYLQLYSYQHVYKKLKDTEYDIYGTVYDIGPSPNAYNKWRILLSNNTLQSATQQITIDKKIALYARQLNNVAIGDVIYVPKLKIKIPQEESIKFYLMRDEIIASSFLNEKNAISIVTRPFYCFYRWLHTKKYALYERLQTKIKSPIFSLFALLFLGFKHHNFYTEKQREYFKYWGLSHFLARSGLHLVLFIMIWRFLLQFIPCWFLLKQFFFIGISSIYFLLTWPTLSFERAFFTFILYCLWIIFNQQINGLHILSLVTLLIIVHNPITIFFLDFQLSFGLTFALLWFNQTKWSQQPQLNSIIK